MGRWLRKRWLYFLMPFSYTHFLCEHHASTHHFRFFLLSPLRFGWKSPVNQLEWTMMQKKEENRKGVIFFFCFWKSSKEPDDQGFVCPVCVCHLMWCDHIQLVVTALKSGLMVHPLVWALQLLLCLSWQSSEVEDRCRATRFLRPCVTMCVCVCVFFLGVTFKTLTRPTALWLAQGWNGHVKSQNVAFFPQLVYSKEENKGQDGEVKKFSGILSDFQNPVTSLCLHLSFLSAFSCTKLRVTLV